MKQDDLPTSIKPPCVIKFERGHTPELLPRQGISGILCSSGFKKGDLVIYHYYGEDCLASIESLTPHMALIEFVRTDIIPRTVWARQDVLELVDFGTEKKKKCECGGESMAQSKYNRKAYRHEHALWCPEVK